MLRVILGIAALTVLASGTAAIAGGKISDGFRASMIVTVLSMSGLYPERSVIPTKAHAKMQLSLPRLRTERH